jgi:hypothetical protein
VSGIARTDEPVTVGVPLPDSAGITSTSVLGLTGATAAQFMVEGKWPSGNIKWVKVRAVVPSLNAGGTATITLTSAGAGNFGGSDMATDNGSTITVSTGIATFTIKKANFNIVDQAVVGSKTVVATGSSQGLVILGPDPTAAYPGNVTCLPTAGGSACTTAYASANDPSSTAVIEENGPAMTVIKATGTHVDNAGHAYMNFTARMYFYKNKSYVKVTSILRNADYGSSNTFATAYKGFQGYELRVSPNISGALNYTIANHTATPTTGTLNTSNATDSAYLYQAESTLMSTGSWCSGTGCVPYTTLSGYSIVKNGAATLTGSSSQYAQGWADIRDSSGAGVEIGQYLLAAYGNKSLEFNGGGTDVRIGIWARQNNTANTYSLSANKPYYMPWPQWSINDVYLNFHDTASSTPANDFLKLQHYLVAAAAPSYYNSCNVFSYPLMDVAEENAYYASLVSSASPAITAPTIKDLGTTDTFNWPLTAYRFYSWATGGSSNQMEFRLAHMENFIRRGFTGNYLDSAHFYKLVAEKAYPLSDGFDWRTKPPSETQYIGYPVATSANKSMAMRNWVEPSQEHSHWYGMPDYYFMSGDETIRDGIIEGPKDSYMNASSTAGGTTSLITGGSFWNSRAVGVTLMSDARLYKFLQTIGDPDAGTLLTNGETTYRQQIEPDLCAYAGYPSGCTPDPYNNIGSTLRQRGVSRTRGITYQWGDTIKQAGCPSNPNDVRDAAPFMVGILLEGIWEFRQAMGPSWSKYNQAFDLGYGITQWAFGEMYVDDGTNSWAANGFRYKQAVDFPNSCNVGSGGAVNDFYWMVQNPNAFWPIFYFKNQYEGSATAANLKRQFDQNLQQVIKGGSAIKDELYHYTVGQVMYALVHPTGLGLNTAPISGFTDNGGGSYTISWSVPAGATSYRIKWAATRIVDWIGFDSGAYTFRGDPTTTTNWFAATDAANIPTPTGSTQSLTINTGTTGLTAANFMVKTYMTAGGTPPPTDTIAPTVSLTAPAAGATVTGTITITANASDNIGVTGVQFRLDGSNLAAPVTTGGPSYSISWNTTAAGAGTHVLTAVASDAAGNSGVSGPVSVTVNNTVAAPVISSVSATAITASSAFIVWVTDVQADSQVAYGPTATYGTTSSLLPALATTHSVTVSGLTASTTYHFQVMSRNSSGVLSNSADFTFTSSAASGGGTGTSVPLNTWTPITASGWPGEILNYDKSEYISSRKLHCVYGAYRQYLSSEHNNAIVCYSYPENKWSVLQTNGYWHDTHAPGVGHTVSIWAYMADKDAIAYQVDGSGSNSPESFLGAWWWYDVGGLTGQNRTFSPRPWLGVQTPLVEMMTYDTYNRKLILYDQAGAVQVCDPNTNSCAKPTITGTAIPSNMTSPNMVYNSTDHKMYLYGGAGNLYTFSCNTNACTTATGALLSVTCTGPDCVSGKPPTRLAAGMAYSPVDNLFMMVGGIPSYASSSFYNDTWIFDPMTLAWRELAPATTYYATRNYFTADRLTYDVDSNVFLMMSINGYKPTMYAFPYSGALNYGRVLTTYAPAAGSLNRVPPTVSTQSWAYDVAITASGSSVYLGWIETGSNTDNSTCGQTHHPYVQTSVDNATWSRLPGGTQAQACLSIDPELSASTNGSKLRIAVVNGTLWEAHEKINHNQAYYSAAFAKQWNGTSWVGGAVGCFFGTCGEKLRQNPQALIAVGNTPTLAAIEWNRLTYTPEGYLYVSQWNGSAWAALGAKLNVNTTGTQVLEAAMATDGTNPAGCWSEQVVASDRRTVTTTPQIQCAQWNGSGWARFGSSSLNRSATSWASDPTITYVGGKYYVGWSERTTPGANQVYVCRWDGTTCTLLGGGTININPVTGWAVHPKVSNDGTNVYVAWEEQPGSGSLSMGYVKQWNGSSWSQVGGVLNADPANGSVEGIDLAVVQGAPTAIWTELSFGNLRQVYEKQWNGSTWIAGGGGTSTPPPSLLPCDLNGDGKVDGLDVQSAKNQALGISPCTTADLQHNGTCTVVGVQRVINASLGGACRTGN